eukprot:TRINITY_DN22463_c0_g1_i6.p1 TRINITY_DN22463_c0_g1~~TRINITY_DN22463_c0_g1_i6.p1  ORF type:complete len:433 (-),score=98.82 TRINITY_DN22463_c0_g1_i6:274-1572(-)
MHIVPVISGADFFAAVKKDGFGPLLAQHGGILQATDVFSDDVAQGMMKNLMELPSSEWILMANENPASQDALHKFYRYEGGVTDAALQPILDLAPDLHPEIHAAKYEEGGNIAVHNDARTRMVEQHEVDRFKNSYKVGATVVRKFAIIYYMTKDWREDYGGCLVDCEGGKERVIVPKFNSIVAFSVPRQHRVTKMASKAPLRLTLFGWFSDGKPYGVGYGPGLLPPQEGGPQTLMVKVPKGAKVGDPLEFLGPDGQKLSTVVPPGFEPGQKFPVNLANEEMIEMIAPENWEEGTPVGIKAPDGTDMMIVPPPGTKPGGRFLVAMPKPVPVWLTVPEGLKAGDKFAFRPPGIDMDFNAVVPEGHKAGDSFSTLIVPPPPRPAEGPEINVAVPPGAKAGDAFQIQSPAGMVLTVTVPAGVKEGETFVVKAPPGA